METPKMTHGWLPFSVVAVVIGWTAISASWIASQAEKVENNRDAIVMVQHEIKEMDAVKTDVTTLKAQFISIMDSLKRIETAVEATKSPKSPKIE